MLHRKRVVPFLALLLSIALAACEGPTGPEGPEGLQGEPGPGSRLVFSGTFSTANLSDTTFTFVSHDLPPAAGTINDPPGATCWISDDSIAWFQASCILLESQNRQFLIVGLIATRQDHGLRYRYVIVY